jgi:hypothetical protein
MMAIHTVEHLDPHSEEARGFPLVHAGLHEPGRSGVPR